MILALFASILILVDLAIAGICFALFCATVQVDPVTFWAMIVICVPAGIISLWAKPARRR